MTIGRYRFVSALQLRRQIRTQEKTMATTITEVLNRKYIIKGVELISLYLETAPGKKEDVYFYRVKLDSAKVSEVAHFDGLTIHLPYQNGADIHPQPQIGDVWHMKADR